MNLWFEIDEDQDLMNNYYEEPSNAATNMRKNSANKESWFPNIGKNLYELKDEELVMNKIDFHDFKSKPIIKERKDSLQTIQLPFEEVKSTIKNPWILNKNLRKVESSKATNNFNLQEFTPNSEKLIIIEENKKEEDFLFEKQLNSISQEIEKGPNKEYYTTEKLKTPSK